MSDTDARVPPREPDPDAGEGAAAFVAGTSATTIENAPTPEPAGAANPAGSSPAPAGSARRAVDEVAEIALDSADLASRSAAAALSAGTELKAAAAQFQQSADQLQKRSTLLLAAASGVMLVALIFFIVVGARMISRIHQLDGMLVAVGKRVVELQSGLETLNTVHRGLDEVARRQTVANETNVQLQARMDAVLKQSEQLAQQIPAVTARQVTTTSDAVSRQMQAINSRLQAQASAVQNLGNDLGALKGALAGVDRLNRDVRALLAVQRERAAEAVKAAPVAAPPAAPTERLVQYPRPAPPQRAGTSDAASPGPAVAPTVPRAP